MLDSIFKYLNLGLILVIGGLLCQLILQLLKLKVVGQSISQRLAQIKQRQQQNQAKVQLLKHGVALGNQGYTRYRKVNRFMRNYLIRPGK